MKGKYKLELSKGQEATLDKEDYDVHKEYNWYLHSGGYAFRWKRIDGKPKAIYLHKEIMKPAKDLRIVFKDGNPLNITRDNMMVCTKSQMSHWNARHSSTSEYVGIYWDKTKSKWAGTITKAGEVVYTGAFKDPKVSAMAYDYHARQVYGDKARLNFPDKTITLEEIKELQKKDKNKSSTYRGVSRHPKNGSWRARLIFQGDMIDLGLFDTEEKAAREYDKEAKKLLKKKAKLNFA